jgi:hypothetical protein
VFGQFAQHHELEAGQRDEAGPSVGGEVCHVQCQAAGPDHLARQAGLGRVDRIGARDRVLP